MDDVFKRVLLTIAFVFGMMLFVYFMIATSPAKPTLLTLVYYNFMNRVFAAIWWFIKISVVIAGISGVTLIIFNLWKCKKNEAKAAVLQRKQHLIREEELKINQEEAEKLEQELKFKQEQQEIKSQQFQMERDRYLKIRSAEEANNDALKHFL